MDKKEKDKDKEQENQNKKYLQKGQSNQSSSDNTPQNINKTITDQQSDDFSQVPMTNSKTYIPSKFKENQNTTQSFNSQKSNSFQLGLKTPHTISQYDFEDQNKQTTQKMESLYEKNDDLIQNDIVTFENQNSPKNQQKLKIDLKQQDSNENIVDDSCITTEKDDSTQNKNQSQIEQQNSFQNQLQIDEIMKYKRNYSQKKFTTTTQQAINISQDSPFLRNKNSYEDIDSVFANQLQSVPSIYNKNSPTYLNKNHISPQVIGTPNKVRQKRIIKINQMMNNLDKKDPKENNPYQEFTVQDMKLLEEEVNKNKIKNEQEIIEFHEKQVKNQQPKAVGTNWKRTKAKILLAQKLCALAQDLKTYGTNPGMTLNNKEIKEFKEFQKVIDHENQKVQKEKHKVFNQEDPFLNTYYPFFLFFIYIYTCIVSPFKIFFSDNDTEVDTVTYLLEKLVDLLFLLDIFVKLNTGYKDNKGMLVTKRRLIFKKYLKFWFLIDILSIFPFEIINLFSPGADNNHIIKFNNYNEFVKILCMIKVNIRMRKASGIKDLSNKIKSTDTSLLWFVVNVLLCAHISACVWYFLAKSKDFAENTWVYQQDLIGQEGRAYIFALYWSIQTITTVGFGDIQPVNNVEQIFCIIWMCFGAGSYSYAVGSLSTTLSQGVSRNQKLQNQTHIMDEFCSHTQIQKDLRYKIKKGLQHANNTIILSSDEKDEFFESIPYPIKWQLSEHMYNAFQYKIPFLKGKDKMFLAQFLIMLEPAQIQAGDNVYKKGEHANLVFFLLNGKVNYIVGNQGLCFKSFVSGSYFGEIEVFRECLRLFTVRCQVNSDFMCMDRDYFISLLQKYSQIDKEMRKLAKQREQQIQKSLTQVAKFQHIYQTSTFWTPKNPHQTYSSIAETIQQNKRKNLVLTKQQQQDIQKKISEEYKLQQESLSALKIKKKEKKQSILILLPNGEYKQQYENSNSQNSDTSSSSEDLDDQDDQKHINESIQQIKDLEKVPPKSKFYDENKNFTKKQQQCIDNLDFYEENQQNLNGSNNNVTPINSFTPMSQIKEVSEIEDISRQDSIELPVIRKYSEESSDSQSKKSKIIKSIFTPQNDDQLNNNNLLNPLQIKNLHDQNSGIFEKIVEVDELMEVSRQQNPNMKQSHQVIFNIDQKNSDSGGKNSKNRNSDTGNDIISQQVKQLKEKYGQKYQSKKQSLQNKQNFNKQENNNRSQSLTRENSGTLENFNGQYQRKYNSSTSPKINGFQKRSNIFNDQVFQLKLKDENTKKEKKLGGRLSLFKPLAKALMYEEDSNQIQGDSKTKQNQIQKVEQNLTYRQSMRRKDSKFLRLTALQSVSPGLQQNSQQNQQKQELQPIKENKGGYLQQLINNNQNQKEAEKWKEKYRQSQIEASIEIKYLSTKLQGALESLNVFEKKQKVILNLFQKLQPEVLKVKQQNEQQSKLIQELEGQVEKMRKQLKKRKQSIQVIGEQNISFGVRIREYDTLNTQNSNETIKQNQNNNIGKDNIIQNNKNNNDIGKNNEQIINKQDFKSQFSQQKNEMLFNNIDINTPQSLTQQLPLSFQPQNEIFSQQLIGTLQTSPTVKQDTVNSPNQTIENKFQNNLNSLNNQNNNFINNQNNTSIINQNNNSNSYQNNNSSSNQNNNSVISIKEQSQLQVINNSSNNVSHNNSDQSDQESEENDISEFYNQQSSRQLKQSDKFFGKKK